ncbi:uncharacterized protein ACBT57_018596 [Dama dama]
MLVLREPQQLQILYDSLEESTPESLKVYGALFHIRNKNPFNLEVLVDAWPEYQTVVIRPQKEEMKDDLDYYINTYHVFTKAPDKLEEVLACPQVINWEQAFQIQGCQENLGKALQKVAASKSVKIDYLRTVLFVFEKPTFEASSGDKMDLMKLIQVPEVLKDRSLAAADTTRRFRIPQGGTGCPSAWQLEAGIEIGERTHSLQWGPRDKTVQNELMNFLVIHLVLKFFTKTAWRLLSLDFLDSRAASRQDCTSDTAVSDLVSLLKKAAQTSGKASLRGQSAKRRARGRDSPRPAPEEQPAARVQAGLSARQVGARIYAHLQDHRGQRIPVFLCSGLLPVVPGGSLQRLSGKTVSQIKGPAKMLQLQGPHLLKMLEKSLRTSLPESLK